MRGLLFLLSLACTGENIIEKQDNSAPIISIGSHSDGAEVQEGYAETFRAQVSDDNNSFDELSVAWYVDDDLACDWTAATPAGEAFCDIVFSPEDQAVVAEVRDTDGAGGRAEVAISVLPTEAPLIELLSPLGDLNYYSDQLIQFSALISDQEDATEDLVIQWTSSVDGSLILDTSPDSAGEISDYTYLSEGQHAIELRVEDSSGKIAVEEVVLQVGAENSLPACGITSLEEQDAFIFGETIIFSGTAVDEDIPNNELSIEWSSDKDGIFDTHSPTSSGEVSTSYSDLSSDTHTITLTVQDEIGSICSDAVIILIGNAPTAMIENPLDGEVYSLGESIVFSGSASDTEDQPNSLTVVWVSNLDGEISQGTANSQGTSQFSSASLTAGLHSISFTVTDSAGLHADDLISFRVNTPPPTPAVTISPSIAYSNSDLIATISGSVDADGDNITYSYEWFENSVLTSFFSAMIPNTELSVGEVWTVRVTPNDGYIDGSFTETSITISNSEPSLSNLTISPSPTVHNTDTIVCSAIASDDDETVTPSYAWTIGSNSYQTSSVDLASIAALPNQTATCTVTVTDSNGGSAVLAQSTTIENRAPSISVVSITPNTAVNINSVLTCSGLSSDPDGETPAESYEWFIDGVSITTGDSISLNASLVSVGDSVACHLSVEDSFGASTTDTTAVTVQNSTPVFDIPVSISPSPAYTGDTLTCAASATDSIDGSLYVSYVWTVGGQQVVFGSSFPITEANSDVGDMIECIATASNSSSISAISSSSVQVQNTVPQIDSITITSNIGIYNDAILTCVAVVSDPDEPVYPTYIWSDGSLVLGSGAALDLSLQNPLMAPNDLVHCIVNLSDSNGGTANFSNQEMLIDRSPTEPAIAISWSGVGSAPVEGIDDLSCIASGSVDPDQIGTVSYTYEWSSDAGATVTGDTVSGSSTSSNEIWTCEVTSFDGSASTVSTVSIAVTTDQIVYGPVSWGTDPEFQNVTIYAVDMGSSIQGSLTEYSNFCASMGMSVPQDNYPANSCTGGGGVYSSSGTCSSLHQNAATFFFNTMLPAYPNATYDNILIFQGNDADCWAHNAESGSMFAFGGPSGNGYAFCRGGGSTSRQYHIYVCKI